MLVINVLRIRDRLRVCLPFEVTDTIGKYNVWCEIETSQEDAMGDTGKSLLRY